VRPATGRAFSAPIVMNGPPPTRRLVRPEIARPDPARASRIRHRPPLPQQPRQHHTGAAGIKKPPGRPDAVIVVVINAASTC